MAVRNLTASDFDLAVADGLCVVDFWAAWCGPCSMQGPILEQLDEAHSGKVKVCKVNVDEESGLAERFGGATAGEDRRLDAGDGVGGRLTGGDFGAQTLEKLEMAHQHGAGDGGGLAAPSLSDYNGGLGRAVSSVG